ncbi:hypothetical protein AVEN_120555-1 [Araneus ventricosus]|uniref:Uncharacterized protein n=1 Tax=Araneus ventricosus TaxID=182803 RepID=A0A4Y2HDS1_ARAVE|nr:hypothetical protein AVEN_120555-1 [Araneus ventricosus]
MYDLMCKRPHTWRIFNGIRFRIWNPQAPEVKLLSLGHHGPMKGNCRKELVVRRTPNLEDVNADYKPPFATSFRVVVATLLWNLRIVTPEVNSSSDEKVTWGEISWNKLAVEVLECDVLTVI